MKTKINSDDDLTLEKTLNMHNVAILVTSGFNKNHKIDVTGLEVFMLMR